MLSICNYVQGLQTSENETEWAILKAEEISNECGKKSVEARVYQEYEPAHFLQLFKGRMTVLRGNAADHGMNDFLWTCC